MNPVVVPSTAHHDRAQVAKPLPDQHCQPSIAVILDFPGLLVYEVRAGQAEVHFWVVAEVNHPVRGINGVAAPARDVSIIVKSTVVTTGSALMMSVCSPARPLRSVDTEPLRHRSVRFSRRPNVHRMPIADRIDDRVALRRGGQAKRCR